MKKRVLWIGGFVVLAAVIVGIMAMRNRDEKTLSVETAQVERRQKGRILQIPSQQPAVSGRDIDEATDRIAESVDTFGGGYEGPVG